MAEIVQHDGWIAYHDDEGDTDFSVSRTSEHPFTNLQGQEIIEVSKIGSDGLILRIDEAVALREMLDRVIPSDQPKPTPHAIRLKLDRRIHKQRMALRQTWEIIDMRIVGARHHQKRFFKMVREFCEQFDGHREGVPLESRLNRVREKFTKLLETKGNNQ